MLILVRRGVLFLLNKLLIPSLERGLPATVTEDKEGVSHLDIIAAISSVMSQSTSDRCFRAGKEVFAST